MKLDGFKFSKRGVIPLLKKVLGFHDNTGVRGIIEINHFRNGKLLEHRVIKNVVCNTGIAQAAGLLDGSQTTYFTALAVGTGTTAASASDTALTTEVMRISSTNTLVTTSVTDDTAQFSATFDFTATYAITEEGIFDTVTASSGIILAHQVFGAINVVSGDSIQFIHKIQLS